MISSIERGFQNPRPLPASWLRPTWDFAFPLHEPEARAQASRLAERYMVLCSNRMGGVSEGVFASMNLGLSQGDSPEHVAENRKRLAQYLPAPARYLRLVHGSDCLRSADLDRADTALPLADAAVLTKAGQSLVMLTGDCLPIVLADARGRALGMAHAGWRGLAAGVIESAVAAMRDATEPKACLIAWIGPCIGPAAFEVGEDVLTAFPAQERGASFFRPRPAHKAEQRWLGDLLALARRRLAQAGVTAVGGGLWCTWHDRARFFSHRRQSGGGRFATAIALRA